MRRPTGADDLGRAGFCAFGTQCNMWSVKLSILDKASYEWAWRAGRHAHAAPRPNAHKSEQGGQAWAAWDLLCVSRGPQMGIRRRAT